MQGRVGACPTCGAPTTGTRPVAAAIGIPNTVLWRFLKGGDMTGRNLDKVIAWLDAPPDPVSFAEAQRYGRESAAADVAAQKGAS